MKLLIGALSLMTFNLAFSQSFADCGSAATGPNAWVTLDANKIVANPDRTYSPKCLKVKLGTIVTIKASAGHPLKAAADLPESPSNPFHSSEDFQKSQARLMQAPGTYGFFCGNHGNEDGGGMAGAILVEE